MRPIPRRLALASLIAAGCAPPPSPAAPPPPPREVAPLVRTVEQDPPAPTSPRRLVTVSGMTTCSIDDNGQVLCWGEHVRPIGTCDGTPVLIPGLSDAVDLQGGERLCARRSNGTVACWSPKDPLRLEELGKSPRGITWGAPPTNDDALVADNGAWGCVAVTGQIECWGVHPFGEEGSPLLDVEAGADVTELVTGTQHVCARVRTEQNAEQVMCWGDNAVGQLGVDPECTSVSPREIAGVDDAVAIASGMAHTCVVRRDGRVSCFGDSSALALGVERAAGVVLVDPPGIVGATAIAAGASHTCVIHNGGQVACFGMGSFGQLGAGRAPDAASKKRRFISEYIRDVFPIIDGQDHALAYADTIGVVAAVTGVANASSLSLSDNASCAMTAAGVRCWGNTGLQAVPPPSGTESDGDCMAGPHPTPSDVERKLAERVVALPDTANARDVAFMKNGGCVVRRDGKVACWGFSSRSRKLQLVEGLTAIVDAVSGEYQICFRDEHGATRCISAFDTPAPGEETPGPAALTKVVGREYSHTCALSHDGTVACDGVATRGQPLTPAMSASEERTTVPALQDVVDIAAGHAFSCAVRGSGKVVCWGEGGPQLGREEVPRFSKKPWIVRGA